MSDEFPKRFIPPDIPEGVVEAVTMLVPQLLEGEHPGLATLRTQFFAARIKEVELTGHGFYADFDMPADVPLADPPRLSGGDATLHLSGAEHGGDAFSTSGRGGWRPWRFMSGLVRGLRTPGSSGSKT